MATSSDYGWLVSSGLAVAYCLTLVDGLTRTRSSTGWVSWTREDLIGLGPLTDRAHAVDDAHRRYVRRPQHGGLGHSTDLVSHYRNVKAASRSCGSA